MRTENLFLIAEMAAKAAADGDFPTASYCCGVADGLTLADPQEPRYFRLVQWCDAARLAAIAKKIGKPRQHCNATEVYFNHRWHGDIS